MTKLPEKELLRPDEVAAYFGVSRSTIYLWIQHGHLLAEKIRGTIRIPRESVLGCRLVSRVEPME